MTGSKLPSVEFPVYTQVENLHKGLWFWRNPTNHISVLIWHYSANPDNDEEWEQSKRMGMSPDDWEREFNINFNVQGSHQAIFAKYFDTKKHIKEDLAFDPKHPILMGIDFGFLAPACVFVQIIDGQVRVLAEIQGHNIYLRDFVEKHIVPTRNKLFPNASYELVVDIAGVQRTDKSEGTSVDILSILGFKPLFKKFYVKEGINIIEYKLSQTLENGEPGLVVSPSCPIIISGFEGGLRWDKNGDLPIDNEFTHLHDALRYVVNYYIPSYYEAVQDGTGTNKTQPLPPEIRNLPPTEQYLYARLLKERERRNKTYASPANF